MEERVASEAVSLEAVMALEVVPPASQALLRQPCPEALVHFMAK